MQIDIRFEGPCADDMVAHGAIDLGNNGFDRVFVGKGETRAVASSRALGVIAEGSYAHLLPQVTSAVQNILSPEAWNIEADGFLCNVFCVIRVKE